MRLSVLMSVYNNAPFLERAISSVLKQTWSDFDFVIINDGCTDGSTEILRRLAIEDGRIRLIEQENRGLVASLNRGFAATTGDLVARMDGDDECLPHRFERQLAFCARQPDYGVVGCQTINVDERGRTIRLTDNYPRNAEQFLDAMESKPLMSHPGSMIARSAFEKVGGYRALYRHCEDYDLWLRMSEITNLCSVDEVLLRYRSNEQQVTSRHALKVAIGAAVAWEAYQERKRGLPDPTAALTALPDVDRLNELDMMFASPSVSRRVRARVAPQILYSVPALASGGAKLLGEHVAEGGNRQHASRAVARLLRHGNLLSAGKLAANLSRSYLMLAH